MSQIIPIFVPTYISDQNYNPSRVQPRLLYYNGQVDCQPYYLVDDTGLAHETPQFAYFDNYSVVSGSQFPTSGSNSLLFFNEQPSYGTIPEQSLFSQYWSDYVNLLYNPRTRLINASAIIPLADYFKMELNDIVSFRGNYYHLRAINDYNLKNGNCKIQLLGPILPESLPFIEDAQPVVPTTTTTTSTTTTSTTTSTTTTSTTTSTTTTTSGGATLAWSYSETGGANGTMDLYINGFAVESRSSTASGTETVYVGDTIYVELQIVTPCGSPDTYANVYTTGNILNDANCANNAGVSLTTGTYTVVSGDIGSTLTLNTFASCDGACI
jgi:hypothetical protein